MNIYLFAVLCVPFQMPGTELNQRLPSPAFENFEMMASDGSAEYFVYPSMYYPSASGYIYYYTGILNIIKWFFLLCLKANNYQESHIRFFYLGRI